MYLLILLWVDIQDTSGFVCSFVFIAIADNATMNILLQVFTLQHVQEYG